MEKEGRKKKVGHFKLIKLGSVSEKPGMKNRAALYTDSLLDRLPKWTEYK